MIGQNNWMKSVTRPAIGPVCATCTTHLTLFPLITLILTNLKQRFTWRI